MLTYSVAIRTLGKNPEVLKRELESVLNMCDLSIHTGGRRKSEKLFQDQDA